MRTLSVWPFLCLVALTVLFLIPIVGIFLVMMQMQWLWGILLWILLATLALDALTNRLPRFFLFIPIGAVGAYYVVYFAQTAQIATKEAAFQEINQQPPMVKFAPEKHALVTNRASSVVTGYKLPTAFSEGRNRITRVHLMAENSVCRDVESLGNGFLQKHQLSQRGPMRGLCAINFPAEITKPEYRFEFENFNRTPRGLWVLEKTVTVTLDGVEIGQYKAGAVRKMSPLPFFSFVCFFGECSAGPITELYRMNEDIPPRGRGIVAEAIGLEPYSEEEYPTFRHYPENAEYVDIAQDISREFETSANEILKEMIANPDNDLHYHTVRILAERVKKRSPEEDLLIDALILKSGSDATKQATWLGDVVANVWPPTLRKRAQEIFGAQINQNWKTQSASLYLKLAEILREGAFLRYKEDLLKATENHRIPMLAICRTRVTDDEVTEYLRKFFEENYDEAQNWRGRAAFLALLSAGDLDFVDDATSSGYGPDYVWYRSTFNKWKQITTRSQNNTRSLPNNCSDKR